MRGADGKGKKFGDAKWKQITWSHSSVTEMMGRAFTWGINAYKPNERVRDESERLSLLTRMPSL